MINKLKGRLKKEEGPFRGGLGRNGLTLKKRDRGRALSQFPICQGEAETTIAQPHPLLIAAHRLSFLIP